jgi:hypothetical protein
MKNLITTKALAISLIAVGLAILTAVSCSKKPTSLSTNGESSSNPMDGYSLFTWLNIAGFNQSAIDIANHVEGHTQEVSIMDNPNYGAYSSTPENDIYFSGFSGNTLAITINGTKFAARDNGQWLRKDSKLKTYFGQNLDVQLTDGANSKSYSFYQPTQMLVTKLGQPNSLDINRTGNVISWNKDAQNTSGKVLLYYSTYNNEEYMSNEGQIDRNFVVLDDNGTWNLDQLISNSTVRRIKLQFVRGNAVSLMSGDEKVLFHMSSVDHHEYIVR